jgi:hypothetical protein
MTGRLTRRALAARWPQVAALLLLTVLVSATVTAALMVRAATDAAVQASVDSRVVDDHVALQPLTPRGVQVLQREQATGGVLPVATQEVELASGAGDDAFVQVATARVTPATIPAAGVLVAGAQAEREGDAVVSLALAEALAVSPGDDVVVDGTTARVVGLLVDPMDPDALALDLRGPVGGDAASFWLRPGPGVPESWLDDVRAASPVVQRTLAAQAVREPGGIPTQVPWIAAALGVAAVASLLGSVGRGARGDLAALRQAGASDRWLRRWQVALVVLVLGAGSAAGWALAALVVRGASGRIGGWWSQYWVDVPLPLTAALGALVLVLAPMLLLVVVRRVAATSATPTRRGTRLFLAVVVTLLVGRTALVVAEFGVQQSAPLLGLVTSVILAVAIAVLLPRWRRDAAGQVTSYAGRGLVALSVILACLVFLGAFRSGWSWHVDEKYERFPVAQSGQAGGAMVVDGLPTDAVERLVGRYDDLGGDPRAAVRAEQVDAGTRSYEAVSPRLATCVQEDPSVDPASPPPGCADASSLGTIYNLGIDPALPGEEARAAPEILVDGAVGLVAHDNDSPATTRSAHVIRATEDRSLGMQMPGLVVGPEHPLVDELGVTGVGTWAVYLADFAGLEGTAQSRFRAAVQDVAPTASAVQRPLGDAGAPSTVQVWSFGTSAAILLVGSLVLVGFHSSFAWLRSLLVSLGADAARRRRLAGQVYAAPALSTLAATATAYVLLEVASHGVPVGFGPYMWAPVAAALGLLALGALAFTRGDATARD